MSRSWLQVRTETGWCGHKWLTKKQTLVRFTPDILQLKSVESSWHFFSFLKSTEVSLSRPLHISHYAINASKSLQERGLGDRVHTHYNTTAS